jgi:hypothetical protein
VSFSTTVTNSGHHIHRRAAEFSKRRLPHAGDHRSAISATGKGALAGIA